MKKAVVLSLCSILTLSMVACASSNTASLATSQKTSEADRLVIRTSSKGYLSEDLFYASLLAPTATPAIDVTGAVDTATPATIEAATISQAVPVEGAIINNISFGISPADLVSSLGEPTSDLSSNYHGNLLGQSGTLMFDFESDLGVLTGIEFFVDQADAQLDSLVDALSAQYGEPTVTILRSTANLSTQEKETLTSTFAQKTDADVYEIEGFNTPILAWSSSPSDFVPSNESLVFELASISNSVTTSESDSSMPTLSMAPEEVTTLEPNASPRPSLALSPSLTPSLSPAASAPATAEPDATLASATSATPADVATATTSAIEASTSNALTDLILANTDNVGTEMQTYIENGARLTYMWNTENADIVLDVQAPIFSTNNDKSMQIFVSFVPANVNQLIANTTDVITNIATIASAATATDSAATVAPATADNTIATATDSAIATATDATPATIIDSATASDSTATATTITADVTATMIPLQDIRVQNKFLPPVLQYFKNLLTTTTAMDTTIQSLDEITQQIASITTSIPANELLEAYEQNSLAAEVTYQDKAIAVDGVIESIYRNAITGNPTVRIKTLSPTLGQTTSVIIAEFENTDDNMTALTALKKGDAIRVAGLCIGAQASDDGQSTEILFEYSQLI